MPPTTPVPAPNPAGSWLRLAGYYIDASIIPGIYFVIAIPTIFLMPSGDSAIPYIFLWAIFVWIFTPLFYGLGFSASPWRVTPGKYLLHMAIIRSDGTPVSVRRLMARETLKWLTGILVIPYAWVLIDKHRRALWDIWTDVVVIKIDN